MADLEHKKEKTEAGKESSGSHILRGDVLDLPLHIAKKVVNALIENDDEVSAEGDDNILDNVSEALTSVEDVIEEHVEEIAESAVKVAEVLGDTISDIEV
ncbi:hypothetical protein IR148_12000 [Dysgonomonas mossii]|uniref:Uncharacterized protein n=1 Tax=Dysgonomonas mossii TaxID=163665 RepID=A0A4Y9IM34_9BACT|nr:hypothetical protein [Dysgonomonas mossii]MBF0761768.1 hypothetical protein [Dysgonomonas mossii]TFU89401.1 hypothetical protein E4T88_11995 [Dysgonomonas mossii]